MSATVRALLLLLCTRRVKIFENLSFIIYYLLFIIIIYLFIIYLFILDENVIKAGGMGAVELILMAIQKNLRSVNACEQGFKAIAGLFSIGKNKIKYNQL